VQAAKVSIFNVFLSLHKQIPIKTKKYRKYYTTAIGAELLQKYQNKLIILGIHLSAEQSEIRTILYTTNSIYIGYANTPPTQEKLAYAYQAVLNLMLNQKVTKTKRKSVKKSVSINSFYVDNNEIYGIQTVYNDKVKSFVTKIYRYIPESDKWELNRELKHEVDSEDVEGVGVIVNVKDLIGPYIVRAEIIMPEKVIQNLLSDLKTKSSKEIENEDYELGIDVRVIVIDISTLNYVTAYQHTYYIKEKLKWLNEMINSFGAGQKETYARIIKGTKKINTDHIFKVYIKSIRMKYSYMGGEYNYKKYEFSNLVMEPMLIAESEIGPVGTVVIKKALDLGVEKVENMLQIGNVFFTNTVLAIKDESGKLDSYFLNPKLKGFSEDGRIFCYYAIREELDDEKKIRTAVTVIHSWDDKSGLYYQYIYDKDAARSIIAYIKDKYTKRSVGIVFSTYNKGYIVIALLDFKNNTTIVREFSKYYQSVVYNNLSNIVRIICGRRYTLNKPSVGEFEYRTETGEVISAFKVKRFYDNVEANYWNSLCKRYIVISDYPKQQCVIYMPNMKGVIKDDTFTFLHDEIEMPILGTRRSIMRDNNTCIFFELHGPVLVVKGPDFSHL
jgi:hypothetical protein